MSNSPLNRRQFGKRAAATSAAGSLSLIATSLLAPPPDAVKTAMADEPPAIAEPIPPQDVPLEYLLLEVVRQLYPDRKLSHQRLREVAADIAQELRRAKTIRAVPLTNANEPAAMFAAYRSEG